MSKTKKYLALFLVFALALSMFSLAGCADDTEDEGTETTEEETTEETGGEFVLVEEGKLLVGSDTAFPPFESMNGDVAEGFDVDLMNAIGEKLDLEVVFMTEIFDTLIPTLVAGGKFDVIASGMTIGTMFTLFVLPAFYLYLARDHAHDRKDADETAASLEGEAAPGY